MKAKPFEKAKKDNDKGMKEGSAKDKAADKKQMLAPPFKKGGKK